MKKIYAIPGLGTTKEIFRELKITKAELIIPEWPLPARNETMKSYAMRFAEKIDTTKPFYLMGVSIGGMICSELCEIISPEKTFIISSTKCRKELPPFIRCFKYIPLHLLLPEKFLRFLNGKARPFIGFEKHYLPEFIVMMNSMPKNYYKYCFHYIANWDKQNADKNIIHIHGTSDKILPYRYVKADYAVKNGTHGMIVNNADEISSVIDQNLQGLSKFC